MYHLPASLYKRFHMKAEYMRAKGFEPLQQEQMVIEYVKEHGKITRSDVMDLCKLNGYQATRVLIRIREKNPRFKMKDTKRGAYYVWEDS